jgi:hypothetical protein
MVRHSIWSQCRVWFPAYRLVSHVQNSGTAGSIAKLPGQACRWSTRHTLRSDNSPDCIELVDAADAEAGRFQDVIQHAFGSYTYQDLLLAAAYLRQHITALHQEVHLTDE